MRRNPYFRKGTHRRLVGEEEGNHSGDANQLENPTENGGAERTIGSVQPASDHINSSPSKRANAENREEPSSAHKYQADIDKEHNHGPVYFAKTNTGCNPIY